MTRADVFELIFQVFMGLGTLVGIVVVAYIMYNAYAYRDIDEDEDPAPETRPTLGELPVGGKGGKKLFLSFGLSAIIVVSLIIWTYGMLLYVENGPDELGGAEEPQVDNQEEVDEYLQLQVEAETFNFGYEYEYQGSSASSFGNLVVPADQPVAANVTSRDVWHTWGVPQERVKADAIPGEYDLTWFEAEETGQYDHAVQCFELCGFGHSGMFHGLIVVESDLFGAIMEAGAIGDFTSALDSGDLSVDSSPDELESYLAAQEESDNGDESGDEDGEESNGDGGSDSSGDGQDNESGGGDGQNNESGGDGQ